jgi:hypothetical protein
VHVTVTLAILGFLALCLLAAGLYDRRVRRTRAGLGNAVDDRTAMSDVRDHQTDVRMRSNRQDFGNPGTFGNG